jgi:3-oxoacyl-[acyl-carrier protein] reductase
LLRGVSSRDWEGFLMLELGLQGRVALVTGANHGIGAATALAFAAQGVAVLAAYHRMRPVGDQRYDAARSEDASRVVAAIEASNGRATSIECDLRETTAAPELFDHAEAVYGPVEILIQNASSWRNDTFLASGPPTVGQPSIHVDAATHDANFVVDARSTALLIAEFARRHIERGANWGRIVGLTSGSGQPLPNEVSYGASKAALESYLRSAAWELGPYGVTANALYPQATDTGWIDDDLAKQIRAASPLGHVAGPEEVAEMVVWLVSDPARFVTGQTIRMW